MDATRNVGCHIDDGRRHLRFKLSSVTADCDNRLTATYSWTVSLEPHWTAPTAHMKRGVPRLVFTRRTIIPRRKRETKKTTGRALLLQPNAVVDALAARLTSREV